MSFFNDLGSMVSALNDFTDEVKGLALDAASQVTEITDGVKDVVDQAGEQVSGVVDGAKGHVDEVKRAFGGDSNLQG